LNSQTSWSRVAFCSPWSSGAGEIVSKEKLIAQAWPNTFVDEAALRVHVAAIRKVPGGGSGARYVENRC